MQRTVFREDVDDASDERLGSLRTVLDERDQLGRVHAHSLHLIQRTEI